MKIKCDICTAVAHGTVIELTGKGWVRAVIINPLHYTITRCPDHADTMNDAIVKVLDGRKGEFVENKRIGTIENGVKGDFEWG